MRNIFEILDSIEEAMKETSKLLKTRNKASSYTYSVEEDTNDGTNIVLLTNNLNKAKQAAVKNNDLKCNNEYYNKTLIKVLSENGKNKVRIFEINKSGYIW
jgi:hypothetical protein